LVFRPWKPHVQSKRNAFGPLGAPTSSRIDATA
jgi:hypothetical protein